MFRSLTFEIHLFLIWPYKARTDYSLHLGHLEMRRSDPILEDILNSIEYTEEVSFSSKILSELLFDQGRVR